MISAAIRLAAAGLARTWTFDTVGRDHLDRLRDRGTPFIFALWHRELLPLLWFHRGVPTTILASRHRDGRYVSDTARRWGFRVVEGSSRRGGAQALRRAVRVLDGGGEVAIAVDGPTGPREVAKPGVVAGARLASAPILPVVALPGPAWTANSWDSFLVPRPFSQILVGYGAPLVVPPASGRERDHSVRELERRMRRLAREVEV